MIPLTLPARLALLTPHACYSHARVSSGKPRTLHPPPGHFQSLPFTPGGTCRVLDTFSLARALWVLPSLLCYSCTAPALHTLTPAPVLRDTRGLVLPLSGTSCFTHGL
ncbi:hypothetical protein Pcinc_014798 [Petrolisthes cinctipes]|uniref:Uncharacterized protein n=1 Tax=Petrolisthes cinctipes TaxID=88211 RepID=A0AAE1FWA2_PETCI|nr:hypothetical protein Pcinc_014798 [Petrolisthes cinctipes]